MPRSLLGSLALLLFALPAVTAGQQAPRARGRVLLASVSFEGEGMLDGSAIARLLDGRLPALERCYERQLLRTPELEGRVLLSARLDASGHPREAHLEGALPEPLASCATRWLEQSAWPAPEGGPVRTQVLLHLRRVR